MGGKLFLALLHLMFEAKEVMSYMISFGECASPQNNSAISCYYHIVCSAKRASATIRYISYNEVSKRKHLI